MSAVTTAPPAVGDPFDRGQGRLGVPGFSVAERDRRYAAVRLLMHERGFDCLLAPEGESYETQASTRYLSQMGGVRGVQRGGWLSSRSTVIPPRC
jgi:hypothetical protein